jgi:hypothetical protein
MFVGCLLAGKLRSFAMESLLVLSMNIEIEDEEEEADPGVCVQ